MSKLPDHLSGQAATDIPWRAASPDMALDLLSELTVFDGAQLLRTFNAMRNQLLALEAS